LYRKADDGRDHDQDRSVQERGYIVVRGGRPAAANLASKNRASASEVAAKANAWTIDWSGTAAQNTELVKAHGVSDLWDTGRRRHSLAQKTGLIVKI